MSTEHVIEVQVLMYLEAPEGWPRYGAILPQSWVGIRIELGGI